MNIKLLIAYDGTNYSGWQVQKNAVTIQQKLQDSIEAVFAKRFSVKGCSRTDSGVHANNFCCIVFLDGETIKIPIQKIPIALNRYLPEDISVLAASFVPDYFHPRYDIEYKEYEYLIWNSDIRNPFLNNRVFCYSKPLDEQIMDRAAKLFIGKHDFASFMASGSDIVGTERNIKYFNVSRNGDMIIINIAADGFLYNMVRILTGTLIEVSEGKIDISDIPEIIQKKDRKNAGFTAPPQGLYLNKVVY